MSRNAPLEDLALGERAQGEGSGRWLGRVLREMIRDGRLRAGSRLPSSRNLGKLYKMARGTVIEVFEQMITEGYLDTQRGSGTYVSKTLPDDFFHPPQRLVKAKAVKKPILSPRAPDLVKSPFLGVFANPLPRAFRAYQPAVDEFPVDLWARIAARRVRMMTRQSMLLTDEFGWPPLREAMANHLAVTRGLTCTAEQIMVVTGTQHALDFVSRLLIGRGESVWMEDPGYSGAAAIFRANGAKIVPVPVDEEGIQVAVGRKRAPDARMAYVTPANQFPLGVLLSLNRRLRLLTWARERGAWIFEDDYDSEFRFTGRPLPALQGLDPQAQDQVIYSCSCNKMLFPTLRIGFLVLPPSLVEPARAARSLLDRYPSLMDQLTLAEFIAEGHFGKYLRKMRQIYAEKHQVLHEAMKRFEDVVTLGRCDTGLQTTAWLPKELNDVEFARRCAQREIEVIPLSPYGIDWPLKHGLHLGFAAVREKELEAGVRTLVDEARNAVRREDRSRSKTKR